VLGVLIAAYAMVQLGKTNAAMTDGGLVLTYRGPGEHTEAYASFRVSFTNRTNEDLANPQARVLAKVADKEWPCQGYIDPRTGAVVFAVNDVAAHPLVIPAGQEVAVSILCRVPDAPLDSAQLSLRR
jgi:hypothetical protein